MVEAHRRTRLKQGCPQKDIAEHEEYAGALIGSGIIENNITNADRPEDGLLEKILTPSNFNQAYKRVKKNKGAGGVDGMKGEELLQYLKDNGEEIRQTIKDGKYRPQPVLKRCKDESEDTPNNIKK